jgi:hypothetical protein
LCKDSSHQSYLHKDEDAPGLCFHNLLFILGVGICVGSVLLGDLFAVKVDGEENEPGSSFCWLRGFQELTQAGRIFRALTLGTQGVSESFMVDQQWGSRPSFSLCCLLSGSILY